MKPLKSTGQVAGLCKSTEPRVAHLVRTGKIAPPPLVVAGRRFWSADQTRQAAQRLGALDHAVELAIAIAFDEVKR